MREFDLECFGIKIMRLKNYEIKNIENVKNKIIDFLTDSPRPLR